MSTYEKHINVYVCWSISISWVGMTILQIVHSTRMWVYLITSSFLVTGGLLEQATYSIVSKTVWNKQAVPILFFGCFDIFPNNRHFKCLISQNTEFIRVSWFGEILG